MKCLARTFLCVIITFDAKMVGVGIFACASVCSGVNLAFVYSFCEIKFSPRSLSPSR